MSQKSPIKKFLVVFAIFAMLAIEIESRGGRGRGGGSFGGLFGGWRKYKKLSTSGSGNSRRTSNNSPMYSTPTKTLGGSPSSSSSLSSMKADKTHASYPKQPNPIGGYPSYGSYGSYNGHHMPPGSTYHPSTAALPAGAIYYAQPPMRSSGTGDFLFGMLAGHAMSNLMFGHRPYVTHVYRPAQGGEGSHGPQVIVINNNGTAMNVTDAAHIPQNYWPTDSEVPLAPFNASLTPEETRQVNGEPIFTKNTGASDMNVPPPAVGLPAIPQQVPDSQAMPPGGIICMPVIFNETDPNDQTKVVQVNKIVCFPAPTQPSPQSSGDNCVTRKINETDPTNPSKTIEVEKLECLPATTEPVAGDIIDNTSTPASDLGAMSDSNAKSEGDA